MALAWFFIATVFFYFAGVFWRYSKAPLELPEKAVDDGDQAGTGPGTIDDEIVERIDAFNNLTMMRYRVGAYGFFIAGLTGLLSLYLALT